MRAILLAAGVGRRIRRHIGDIPKSTVTLNGPRTLIRYTVEALRCRGIDDVTVVVGYQSTLVREALSGLNVRFVENPWFEQTNSIASLWLAREHLVESTLVMNADTFLDGPIFDLLIGTVESPVMLWDTSRRFQDMDYKLGCENGLVRRYGKDLDRDATHGEYVGAAKIAASEVSAFRTGLEDMIEQGEFGAWWENVLYRECEATNIHARDVSGWFWAEVDTLRDYARIKEFLATARAAV